MKFDSEIEIKKIQHVFRFMLKDREEKTDIYIGIGFHHFEDTNLFRPGHAVGKPSVLEAFIGAQLVKYCFQKIVLFAALIENKDVTYRLAIMGEPGENDGPLATVDCFFKSLQGHGSPGPHISKEIPLSDVRSVIWNAYRFFVDNEMHPDIRADLLKTFIV